MSLAGLGRGPWYIALLVNENQNGGGGGSKHKTEIRLHTYAYEFAAINNALDIKDNWVTQQLVGPFERLCDAEGFFRLWTQDVRGKTNKENRGDTLYEKYKEAYGLTMWRNTQTQQEIERVHKKRKREWIRSTAVKTRKLTERIDIRNIKNMNEKTKKIQKVS